MNILIKPFIFFALILAFCSCSKETPKQKAKRYLGYMDTFYFDLTDAQENKAEEIIDIYFKEKKKSSSINNSIYTLLKDHLEENRAELNIKEIEELVRKKRAQDAKIAPILLKETNDFYKMLSKDQKKELLSSLESLKKKSTSFRFWLGED